MRYRKPYSKPRLRTITVKYPGPCACCGAEIKAGELADYYPIGTIASRTTSAIAHVGGLDGNSQRCYVERCKQMKEQGKPSTLYPDVERDPGFVDLDRMYDDQCADICGR